MTSESKKRVKLTGSPISETLVRKQLEANKIKAVSRVQGKKERRFDTIRRLAKKRFPRARSQKKRDQLELGAIVGSSTGERDRDPMGGGWEGTDDATSTAPSDLAEISNSPTGRTRDPDVQKEADDLGNASEMKVLVFPGWRPEKLAKMF